LGLQEGWVITLEQLPGATETAVSFQIENEDHTLGNALRYFINKKSALQLA
jgi:DNA-directed RNA polymerase I and III subunit RPAC2